MEATGLAVFVTSKRVSAKTVAFILRPLSTVSHVLPAMVPQAEAEAEATLADIAPLFTFAVASAVVGLPLVIILQNLNRLTGWWFYWLCAALWCTDIHPTNPTDRPDTATTESPSATWAFYLLATSVAYCAALDNGSCVNFSASVISMAWSASQRVKLLENASSCRHVSKPSIPAQSVILLFRRPRKIWLTRSVKRGLRRAWIVWFPLVALALVPTTSAALTLAKCVQDNCIQRRGYNTICYYPNPIELPPRSLCANSQLRRIMDIHRDVDAIGPSIVYYELQTSKPLGNSTLVLKNPQPDTGVVACATGLRSSAAGVRLYQTRCWLADADEDFGSEYGDRACSVIHEQSRLLEPECESGEVHSPHFKPTVGISRAIRSVLGALAAAEVR